jgi:hypothetical protein
MSKSTFLAIVLPLLLAVYHNPYTPDIEYDDKSSACSVIHYKCKKNILNDDEEFTSDLEKRQYSDH